MQLLRTKRKQYNQSRNKNRPQGQRDLGCLMRRMLALRNEIIAREYGSPLSRMIKEICRQWKTDTEKRKTKTGFPFSQVPNKSGFKPIFKLKLRKDLLNMPRRQKAASFLWRCGPGQFTLEPILLRSTTKLVRGGKNTRSPFNMAVLVRHMNLRPCFDVVRVTGLEPARFPTGT